MRILLIGTGTIGGAINEALEGHEVVRASRSSSEARVDIRDAGSVRSLFASTGACDAIICAAGSGAWKPLDQLTDDDFEETLHYKLMGQANVIRYGVAKVRDGGVIVVTTGVLAHHPMPGSAAISLANGGLESFVRAAALEAPRGIRVNVISPPWVNETLEEMGMKGIPGLLAATVAKAYVDALQSNDTGRVIELKPDA
jgi:NAD(P)-dependent dehydrogenase (short-subunit alcohol dehydrogenase family)